MFDKSFLESLNLDEAVWLDQFFLSSITPLFFVETLADLEKQVHRGRTPEQVVGSIARKTPDMQAHLNPHHMSLLWAELNGEKITMDGRIMRAGGQLAQLDGQQAIFYQMSPEEEAFNRWQNGEFLDLERQIAKKWRRDVSNVDHSKNYALFKNLYGSFRRPRSLADAKHIAGTLIDLIEEELSLRFGLSLVGVPPEFHDSVVQRWAAAGKKPLGEFAPYFRHDQSFIKGPELKADLRRIDEHFSSLPDEVKSQDLFKFAMDLPEEACPLVVQLWDKHLIDPNEAVTIDKIAFLQDSRKVSRRKGKWLRVPPEA